MRQRYTLFAAFDMLFVTLIFMILIWMKPGTLNYYLPLYYRPFLYFLALWLIVSVIGGKYVAMNYKGMRRGIGRILDLNFVIMAIVAIVIYGFQQFEFSRIIVFGTILFSTLVEMFAAYVVYNNLNRNRQYEYYEYFPSGTPGAEETVKPPLLSHPDNIPYTLPEVSKDLIIRESSDLVYDFVIQHINHVHRPHLILSTTTEFNISNQPDHYFHSVINLKKINDIKRVNKFFEAVNQILPVGGIFIDSVETNEIKKTNILKRYPPLLNHFIYFWHYIYFRVIPKLPITKQIFFFITNGYDRAVSKAETFGRLYCCGFELLESREIGNLLYFVAEKKCEPAFDFDPTYGVLIRLKRIGKNGKIIKAYKFRTMHPYAEYIQEYVFQNNALREGGKFKDDYRVTTLGRFARKVFIDELPMLACLFKGEVKLIGVRPLSEHYYSLYPDDLKQRRIRYKPGLIPPFYADLPKTFDEIVNSEKKYLDSYEKHHFRTDLRYFFKATYNIVFRHARSN